MTITARRDGNTGNAQGLSKTRKRRERDRKKSVKEWRRSPHPEAEASGAVKAARR
jgi:hypothetical protein